MKQTEKQVKSYEALVRMAAFAATGTALLLVIMKLYAWFVTDASAMLASSTDSMLDLFASIMNVIILRYALAPADDEHKFGHGKAESLAGLVQAAFVLGSAILLLINGVDRVITPKDIVHSEVGIWVTVIAIILTLLLVILQKYVIKQTDSVAISADALHYQSDLFLNLGVLAALFLSQGYWLQADGVFTIGVGLFLMIGAGKIIWLSVYHLMDSELTEAVRWRLNDLISLPIEDVVVDIFALPEDAYHGRMKILYAAVASKEVINKALSFVRQIGLNNKVVDIYEMSLRNIALNLPEMDFGTVALLRMQENQGSMLMFSHESLYLTRQIELGYSSFATGGGAFSLDNEVMIDRLALDIQRSLDYYESQLGKGVANKIYILPLGDENVHFKDELETQLHAPVLHFDCREFVSFAPDVGPNIHDQAYCLPAIGAVLRRES